MGMRIILFLLLVLMISCGKNTQIDLQRCENTLDSIETILNQHPDYAATEPRKFWLLRQSVIAQLERLDAQKNLSDDERQQHDLLVVRSSLLFTAALEEALRITRKQADSLAVVFLRDSLKLHDSVSASDE
jgi:hypothetical protein